MKSYWTGDRIAVFFGEVIAQRRHDLRAAAQDKSPRGPWPFSISWTAQRIGVSPSTLWAWEHGLRLRMVRPHHFWKLSRVLQLTPHEMLEAAGYLPSSKFAAAQTRRSAGARR